METTNANPNVHFQESVDQLSVNRGKLRRTGFQPVSPIHHVARHEHFPIDFHAIGKNYPKKTPHSPRKSPPRISTTTQHPLENPRKTPDDLMEQLPVSPKTPAKRRISPIREPSRIARPRKKQNRPLAHSEPISDLRSPISNLKSPIPTSQSPPQTPSD
jgi:hypothetical protein